MFPWRIHTWTQDLRSEGRGYLVNFRWAWRLDRHDARQDRDVAVSGQVVVPRKPQPKASIRFHAGDRSSDTPWDAHLGIGGAAIYLGTTVGRTLAHRLSRGEGRDFWAWGEWPTVYLHVWTTTNSWTRGRFAEWRDASFSISPIDRIMGPRSCNFEKVATVDAELVLSDGTYPVQLALKRATVARRRGGAREAFWDVFWDARHGIPYKHDNGWKGGSVYGSDVKVSRPTEDDIQLGRWVPEALDLLAAQIYKWRAEEGFVAEPVQS